MTKGWLTLLLVLVLALALAELTSLGLAFARGLGRSFRYEATLPMGEI